MAQADISGKKLLDALQAHAYTRTQALDNDEWLDSLLPQGLRHDPASGLQLHGKPQRPDYYVLQELGSMTSSEGKLLCIVPCASDWDTIRPRDAETRHTLTGMGDGLCIFQRTNNPRWYQCKLFTQQYARHSKSQNMGLQDSLGHNMDMPQATQVMTSAEELSRAAWHGLYLRSLGGSDTPRPIQQGLSGHTARRPQKHPATVSASGRSGLQAHWSAS